MLSMSQIRMLSVRVGCAIVLATASDSVNADDLNVLQGMVIVELEAQSTHLVSLYSGPIDRNHYESGIDAPEFEHGYYESTMKVVEVLYGDAEIPPIVSFGPYPTFERGWQAHGWAFAPPLQAGERITVVLQHHPLHGIGWRSDWGYLMSDHPTAARVGTPTFERDLELLTAIGVVLDADADEQWRLLHEYGTGDDQLLATWATEIALEELKVAKAESVNHDRAAELLRAIAAALEIGDVQRPMILHHLGRVEATRENWLSFIERLALSEYRTRDEALPVLAQLLNAVHAAAQQEMYAGVRARVFASYALALANRSISTELREIHVRQLGKLNIRPKGFTDQHAFDVLVEVLRQSDESAIELAAAQTIRDSFPLTAERRTVLEELLNQVETTDAAGIIRAHLAQN